MVDLNYLINSSIEYHDTSSLYGYKETSRKKIIKLNEKYPQLLSKDSLIKLISEPNNTNFDLASIIIDNISDMFDYESNDIYHISARKKNILAVNLGFDDYFSLYCKTRGKEKKSVIKDFKSFLKSTDDRYLSFISILPDKFKSRKNLTHAAGLINNLMSPLLSEKFKKAVHSLSEHLESIGIKFVHNEYNRVGVAFNISQKSVVVNLTNEFNLETLRALFHALGHTFYFVDNLSYPLKITSSDTTSTEVWALFFENIISSNDLIRTYFGLPEELSLWQDFLFLYYYRLYAIKAISESDFYESSNLSVSDINRSFSKEYEFFMHVKDDVREFQIDEKPISVEFAYACMSQLSEDLASSGRADKYVDLLTKGLIR